jgi:hypothetical protein
MSFVSALIVVLLLGVESTEHSCHSYAAATMSHQPGQAEQRTAIHWTQA